MTSINVKRLDLLERLKGNRDKHRAIFVEAQEGYRAMAIAELDEWMAEARAGKRIRRTLTLVEPIDQTKEYDRAIQMLEMSIDETLLLSETDFQCYVMDEWHWKHQFNASNMRYSKTLMDAQGL